MVELSVLMSVRNGERFLAEAVESVLNQTYEGFEFIILDNASSDRSVEIVESFKDSRIRLIRNGTDLGQTRALNVGLTVAKGRLLARMDADDVSLKDRLRKQMECFEANPETAVVGTWHHEIDENGRFLKSMRYPVDPLEIKCHLLSDGDLTRRCLAHPTVMMKTSALRELGGYDESVRFAQDYELWTRFIARYELRNIPEPLFQYRVNRKSTSNTNRAEMTRELDWIVAKLVWRLWPDVDETSARQLTSMLRNRRPTPGTRVKEIGVAFDGLFARLFQGQELTAHHLGLRERIKMYYWPRVAAYDFGSALTAFHPSARMLIPLVADAKFQKNLAKTLLRR